MHGLPCERLMTAVRYTLSVVRRSSPALATSRLTENGSSIRYTPRYSPFRNSSQYCVVRALKGSSRRVSRA